MKSEAENINEDIADKSITKSIRDEDLEELKSPNRARVTIVETTSEQLNQEVVESEGPVISALKTNDHPSAVSSPPRSVMKATTESRNDDLKSISTARQ